jgi:uncharacterized protein (DUF1330 family)
VDIAGRERVAKYMAAALTTVEAFGGRYIVRSGNIEMIEGDRGCDRVVVIEFLTREQALSWHNSRDYRPLRDVRWQAAKTNILLVQ